MYIDELRRRILDWLGPSDFNEILEHSQELREDGTGEWLFETPEFVCWREFDSSKCASGTNKITKESKNVLWIHGRLLPVRGGLDCYINRQVLMLTARQSRMWKDCTGLFNGGRTSDST